MKINVCVNGSFRYPQYIRWYAAAGALGAFHFAHRRSTTAARLGLADGTAHNGWVKESALQAAWRCLPDAGRAAAETVLCNAWQQAVVRKWTDCDTVEAVIGAVADKVLAHARSRGARVLGHPVCAHPDTVALAVGRAHADLGLDPRQARPSHVARRAAETASCDALLVDSRAVARSYARAGFPVDRISVITPALDMARFRPRRTDACAPGLFRVVCVATITPRKAQHLLLDAWRRLALPEAELVLVGPRGPHAAAVVRGHAGRFTYVGRIPNDRLRDLLVTATAFVLPSVEDGFGQAVVEAMACGVPVILTDTVGAADLVTDGHEGFVVPAFDAEALSARLEQLFRDRALACAMGQAAAATAAAHSDWAAYVQRVLAVHRSLLNKSSSEAEAA